MKVNLKTKLLNHCGPAKSKYSMVSHHCRGHSLHSLLGALNSVIQPLLTHALCLIGILVEAKAMVHVT